MQTKRVILYYEDNPYEPEEVYIEINDMKSLFLRSPLKKLPGIVMD